MPRKAKIFLAEDDILIRDIVAGELKQAGHTVVLKASSKKEGLEKVKLLRKNKVNVAILNNSLGGSWSDGSTLYREIKKECPEITIICFSLISGSGWADIMVFKPEFKKLVNAVKTAPSRRNSVDDFSREIGRAAGEAFPFP